MTIDLTPIILSVIGGVFSIVTLVVGSWINNRLKDQQAATTLRDAVTNGLGMVQMATQNAVRGLHPSITVPGIPGVTPEMMAGVQYVLEHAGPEAARFGITPASIADKLTARLGNANIATNLAIAASSGSSPQPIAPVPVTEPEPLPGRASVRSGL